MKSLLFILVLFSSVTYSQSYVGHTYFLVAEQKLPNNVFHCKTENQYIKFVDSSNVVISEKGVLYSLLFHLNKKTKHYYMTFQNGTTNNDLAGKINVIDENLIIFTGSTGLKTYCILSD